VGDFQAAQLEANHGNSLGEGQELREDIATAPTLMPQF
jgi:hypothetical protein